MSERVDRLLQVAEDLGFRQDGHDGRGHLRLVHENGTPYRIAATPGDWKGDKNAVADMQRISGRKLDKQRHRRSRKNFGTEGSTPTFTERRNAVQFAGAADAIEREAEALLSEWRTIIASPSRQNRDRAAEICALWSELSRRLEAMHRPPLHALPVSS